ncbi:hypothetical protein OMP43_03175 [Sphingomonas sp. CBMAI 2297]|uniref:hypothetical protein n=1 Tax=Sphingomonas sp. CBMAI 2297 TaxID=2991720 RepID=UPI002453E5D5|nr:hypothetical protein [Sphingomonas sp. CBMAI 2297]MDH4743016.1 hypothetical protein [Sphingomonas sp. CBMAI 2297]
MSSMASTRGGSWAQAWLAGAFVPFAIGTTFILAWNAWSGPQSEPGLTVTDWAPMILLLVMLDAAIAAAVALGFVYLVRFAERRGAKPLSAWLQLGLVAVTPVVLLLEGFLAVDPFDREGMTIWRFTLPAFYLYGASLIGALTTWRIRRGAWRA